MDLLLGLNIISFSVTYIFLKLFLNYFRMYNFCAPLIHKLKDTRLALIAKPRIIYWQTFHFTVCNWGAMWDLQEQLKQNNSVGAGCGWLVRAGLENVPFWKQVLWAHFNVQCIEVSWLADILPFSDCGEYGCDSFDKIEWSAFHVCLKLAMIDIVYYLIVIVGLVLSAALVCACVLGLAILYYGSGTAVMSTAFRRVRAARRAAASANPQDE